MEVVTVIPLCKGNQLENLTYYSSTHYPIGTIIEVPLRNSPVLGLVTNSVPASATKTALRRATFSLKRIPAQTATSTLPPTLLETAKQLAERYPYSVGGLLHKLLPKDVHEYKEVFTPSLPCIKNFKIAEITVLQALFEERIRVYRSKIREAFAHRGSVLIVVPTSSDVDNIYEHLKTGIEKRIVVLSNSQTKKQRDRAYQLFTDVSQAQLIIATPSHCFLERHDLTNIIIEQSNSQFYRMKTRPYLDMRDVLKVFSAVSDRQLLLGDIFPDTNDEQRRRDGIYSTEDEHPKRLVFPGNCKIIKQNDKPTSTTPFELYDKKVLEEIRQRTKKRERVFVYAARRGLAPVVACIDCGHIFRCKDSGAPYSLLLTRSKEGLEERWFVSSAGGKKIPAADTCTSCGSWRLRERGIGIQHMFSELKTHLDTEVILFDHTTASTKQKAQQIMSNFFETKGAVLIGTAMALPFLDKSVHLSVVPSVDALRTIPTWRAEEEFFSTILRIREFTTSTCLIQTRTEIDTSLSYTKSGQVEKFYDEELELRQALSFPPYSTFVHLTITGSNDYVTENEAFLKEKLQKWNPQQYPSLQSTANKKVRHTLITIPASAWPDAALMSVLKELPPSIRIEINPNKIV